MERVPTIDTTQPGAPQGAETESQWLVERIRPLPVPAWRPASSPDRSRPAMIRRQLGCLRAAFDHHMFKHYPNGRSVIIGSEVGDKPRQGLDHY